MDADTFRSLVARYFSQLVYGCGKPACKNPNCASMKTVGLVKDEALRGAVELVKLNQPQNLCRNELVPLDFASLEKAIGECVNSNSFTTLIRRLGAAITSLETINCSFLRTPVNLNSPDLGLDVEAVVKTFRMINNYPNLKSVFENNVDILLKNVKLIAHTFTNPQSLRLFVMLFLEGSPLYDPSCHHLLAHCAYCIVKLPASSQVCLQCYWASLDKSSLMSVIGNVQQYITVWLLMSEDRTIYDESVVNMAKLLGLIYAANAEKSLVPYTEFYNEMINERISVRDDFLHWKKESGFSYCNCPFVLQPDVKSKLLQFENEVEMMLQRRSAIEELMEGGSFVPILGIKVRRENLLQDSLHALSGYHSEDLKKELKIHFVREEAIDAGGVKKEWFQLMLREIFDAKYGMFIQNDETRTHWFNSHSEDYIEFELIGKILGLAIYNGVILDLHFPRVLYKKLVKVPLTLEDLKDTHPGLASGLEKLLNFPDEVEDVFSLTFQITEDFLGMKKFVDLKPNGAQIPVTNANRAEYVELYKEYLLNGSIKKQFDYFSKGFYMLCNTPGFKMFRHEELELLVCGSPSLDFTALESNTQYEGYTPDHPVVRNFWDVVHSLSPDKQRRLLFFSTGSDRAPIGGLAKLPFVIMRHGEDSDRLPSAHTCFNHLLLPEYSSREKLRERLETAIMNAEGFGLR